MLEELIPGPVTKEQFENIFQNFKKAFIERALDAEMSHHLGYAGQSNVFSVNFRNLVLGCCEYAASSSHTFDPLAESNESLNSPALKA